MTRDEIMEQFFRIRQWIADGDTSSRPRDAFENLLDVIEEDREPSAVCECGTRMERIGPDKWQCNRCEGGETIISVIENKLEHLEAVE